MRQPLRILALTLTFASLAHAQQHQRPLKKAINALEDAARKARRGGPTCSQRVQDTLEHLVDQAQDLKRDARLRDAVRLKHEVSQVASTATWSSCPEPVVQSIHRAEDLLDDVRDALYEHRYDDDDDDDGRRLARLSPLQVFANSSYEGEPAVQVQLPELTIQNMRGQQFYLGARFRSFQGHWSDWVTTQRWTVPADPFVWKNPFTHYFRASTLAEDDFSDGRFVARVAIFDARGNELAFREVSFKTRLPQLPPMPVPPPQVARDCGTGPDVGCTMVRDGRYPMDAVTFQGFMRSLEGNSSEMMRLQTVQTLFGNNAATAVQFGLILDLFKSEMMKFQAAQYGATRVVNPQHAIGYADKFNSNLYRTSFTQLMAEQRPDNGAPPPMGFRQPGAVGLVVPGRDCGTGQQDPGCSMQRNGLRAMDGTVWVGFYASLRATPNELARQGMVNEVLTNQALTAAQFGLVLDLFNNELTRLDVARAAAGRLVNPMHAMGYSAKFANSILAQDYVTVIGQQR